MRRTGLAFICGNFLHRMKNLSLITTYFDQPKDPYTQCVFAVRRPRVIKMRGVELELFTQESGHATYYLVSFVGK